MDSKYDPQRRCPKCRSSKFKRGPGGSTSYWSGYRLVPVVCANCGHSMGYGILTSLPRFEPPAPQKKIGRHYALSAEDTRPPRLPPVGANYPSQPRRRRKKIKWIISAIGTILSLIIVVAVVGAIAFYMRSDDPNEVADFSHLTPEPSPTPTLGLPTPTSGLPTSIPDFPNPTPDVLAIVNEAEVLLQQRINQYREEEGLTLLVANPSLADVARTHSEDMAAREFFDHQNPDGLAPQDRVEKAGIWDYLCNENLIMQSIYFDSSPEGISEKAFKGWLYSPDHHETMITPGYGTGGMGMFIKSKTLIGDTISDRYIGYTTHLLCADISEYNQLEVQYQAASSLYEELPRRV